MAPATSGRREGELPERTLVVRCPRWALRALGLAEVEPVVVVAGGIVVAASAAAAAEGVRAGLRRRDAEARVAGLVVHGRDEALERRAFEPVVAALETFGVPVTVRAPGWAAFGTRGPARRLGGEAGLVAAVEAALGAAAEPPGSPSRWWRVGIADGAFCASLAAARDAVVPRGEGAAFLAPLPVELLGDEELAGLLRRLGIGTLGAFAALEPSAVLARFGGRAGTLQALAAGRGANRLAGRLAGGPAQAEQDLDPPTARLEATLFVARGLAAELAASLGRRGLACTLLAIEVALGDGTRLERRWSGRGSLAPGLVVERLRAQLEAWAAAREAGRGEQGSDEEHPVEVAGVRLVALEAVPDRGDQRSLWGRRRPGDDERVARAVARLEGVLGPRRVFAARTAGGRGPGERARLLPFGESLPPSSRDDPEAAPWPGRLPAPSPAIVPDSPLPAEVLDAAGTAVAVDARGALSAAPVSVSLGAGPARLVQAWAGPFPVDERWWEGAKRRRRARLQVVLADGAAFLLALERGRWLAEGSYD